MRLGFAAALLLCLSLAASAKQDQDVIDDPFPTGASGPKATLRLSKSHGLWSFLCAVVKRDGGNQKSLAEDFDKSEFNNQHFREKFAQQDYQAVCKDPYFNFLWERLAKASAKAESLSAFLDGLPQALADSSNDPKMAADNAKDFKAFLSELAPVYEKLVWKPSLKRLQLATKGLLDIARQADLADLYGRAEAFYGSSYPGPLLIAVAPVPHGQGANFQGLKDVFLIEIAMDERSLRREALARDSGVILQEMCHGLYDQMPEPARPNANGRLNDALAAAIGAWAERRMTGQEADQAEDCGYDSRTCAYAKALYPQVAEYLKDRRPMDQAFLAFARQQNLALPGSPKPTARALSFLAADGAGRKAMLKDLRAKDEIAALRLGLRGGYDSAEPQRKPQWQKAILDAAVDDILAMPEADSDPVQSLAFKVLSEMAAIIRWQEEVPDPAGRDPHEWPGLRVLAEGNFNGCVEAAKAFKALFDAAGPAQKAKYVISTLKHEDGGHAVVEVAPAQGGPILIDTAGFEALKAPGRLRSFADLAGAELVRHEREGRFRGPGDKDYFIVLKTEGEPFSGTDPERISSGQRGLEDKVKNAP